MSRFIHIVSMAKHQILFGPAIFGKVADIVSMMKDYRLVLAFIYIISIVISRETKLVVSCVVPERRLIMPTNFRSGTLITRAKPNQTVSDMTNKGRIGKARQRGLYLTYPLIPRDQLEYLLACHLRLFWNGRLSLGGFHCAARSRVAQLSLRVRVTLFGGGTCTSRFPFAFLTFVLLELKQTVTTYFNAMDHDGP